MDNNEVLAHLLKIESEAAKLVDNAQAEADRRVAEAEKEKRAAYDVRYRIESERLENEFQKSKEVAQQRYLDEMEAYKQKISSTGVNKDRFSVLLDKFVLEEA